MDTHASIEHLLEFYKETENGPVDLKRAIEIKDE